MDTPTLSGRPVAGEDLQFLMKVWGDERVASMIGGMQSDAQQRERIERWTHHWNAHGFGPTLFHERASGKPIGWGGLQYSGLDIGERLTVGYVIAPKAWGRGYATEIANASVGHAFRALGARQLYASVLSTNHASRRVLEKAGLHVDSEVDRGDHVEVIYVIEQ